MTKTKEGLCSRNIRVAACMTSVYAASLLAMMQNEANAGVSFRTYQTHSHIQLPLDPQVAYSVEKIERDGKTVGFKLKISNVIGWSDDPLTVSNFKDERTAQVKFTKNRTEDGEEYVYEFMLTPQAIANGVEYFDYRSSTPYQLQLDYWTKKGAAPVAAPVASKPDPKLNLAAQKKKFKKTAATTKTTKSEIVEGSAADKMTVGCGNPLKRGGDAFVYYKLWHRPFSFKGYFKLETPDTGYEYPAVKPDKNEKIPGREKEVAHYRLAHKLYGEKQFALVLRTVEFFLASYPKSTLRDEVKFLKINTMLRLGEQLKTDAYKNEAIELIRLVILESPDSVRAKKSLAYLVQELMERQEYARVLEYAIRGGNNKETYEKNPNDYWVYRLATAEALYSIGEFERAEQAFESVITSKTAFAPEAAYRVGDLYALRKFHERASIAYERALKAFPGSASKFATAWFNLAESYYKLDRFAESKHAYSEFIKRFPLEEYVWAARYRVAELDQIMLAKADPSKAKAIEHGYEDVVNNHPYSVGAQLAEARIAQCHRNTTSDVESAFFVNFFMTKDIKKLEDKILDGLEVQVVYDLAELRFNLGGGVYDKALKSVDIYREIYSKMAIAPVFKAHFAEAVQAQVKKLAHEGKGAESLAFVEKYEDLAPNPQPFGYMLALARAAFDSAKLEQTAKNLNVLKGLLGSATSDEADGYHYLNAQLMQIRGEKPDAVIVELNLIADSGTFSALKLDELAKLALLKEGGKGDLQAALNYDGLLVRGDLYKKLTSERSLAAHLRYLQTLSRLGRHEDVIRVADQTILKYGLESKFAGTLFRVREIRAESLVNSGDDKGAVSALTELIKANPTYGRRPEFEFTMAKSLTKLGRDSEAVEKFRELANSAQDSIWKKSAKAELDQMEWENGITNQSNDRRSK